MNKVCPARKATEGTRETPESRVCPVIREILANKDCRAKKVTLARGVCKANPEYKDRKEIRAR